ncbi:LysR family transcriptional regulator [Rhodoplanes sp. TEM]|uniref:LysR family transcriptional regulator n=1 Tax=Rhodoplanes tepidamans TaxID=200616 RepID=A0ABT5JAZ1_RHOTP|nr:MULTISPECIES: LysR family transcriptional regulator [Rhodoplanes]MDC7786762.1 LysR family transcriptional regulator [Rhodoplanes tepidamans]MDC7983768.1 LysR family transcriptional regulator [Rhodoplanes sp. TEM]MDQ0358199.1 DNA-binding transcriptional LysR family regulator [Rhodoplanes tepidamans]
MDRFDAMRVFTRVVERRSFSKAAEDLGLPRSSVTEAVKALEARLGVRLLQRTTRHVGPTLDGEAYYRRCVGLLADLDEAEGAFAGASPKGLLHVGVHGGMASRILVPHLPEFLGAYPDIEVQLSESDRYVDLLQEGMDCVLRVGTLTDSDLVARRLTALPEATCASPDYLARHGVPHGPDDLDGHRMVGFRSSATGAVLPLEFMVAGERREVRLPSLLTVNGAETYAAAARAGLGLIQAPRYRLEADFRSGALVPVLAETPPSPTPVSVLYPRAKHLSPRLRAFIDWIAARLRAEGGGEAGRDGA